ncbi:MAG: hypothetical protein RB296_01825 [Acidobacteriota bacterium]|jgi:hypothetical protein|nr:hypothetical protein [Acidobacteriota bacterium]
MTETKAKQKPPWNTQNTRKCKQVEAVDRVEGGTEVCRLSRKLKVESKKQVWGFFIHYSFFLIQKGRFANRLLPIAFGEAKGTVFLIPSSLFLIQSFVLPSLFKSQIPNSKSETNRNVPNSNDRNKSKTEATTEHTEHTEM